MHSFSEIVDRFGIAALAALLKTDESHVRVMKTRDSIPPEYWGALIEAAPERGIDGLTYPLFRELRSARFNKDEGSPPTAPDQTEPEKAKAS